MPIMKTEIQKFEERFEPVTETGCWLWTGALWGGGRYGCFGGKESAHKASLRLYKGRPTTKDEHVCHKCDVTICVNPDHLFVGDMSSNMRDQVNKNRKHNHLEKLDKDAVERCIKLRESGYKLKDLAAMFGISESHMSRVTRGFRTYYNPETYSARKSVDSRS